MKHKDNIFAAPIDRVGDFDFGEQVAEVFDDMLSRCVPLYEEVQYMITDLAANFATKGSVIYDLGCSTGTTLLALAKILKGKEVHLFGVDASRPMLEQAQAKFEKAGLANSAIWLQHDLNAPIAIDSADVFIMNLTLQFVRPLYRDQLIANLYRSLKPCGCLILVEKVLADDSLLNRAYIELYYALKRRKGYSEMEIAQKREALENVLIPYRVSENLEMLKRNGFVEPDIFFRWYNFAGFIAIKR